MTIRMRKTLHSLKQSGHRCLIIKINRSRPPCTTKDQKGMAVAMGEQGWPVPVPILQNA